MKNSFVEIEDERKESEEKGRGGGDVWKTQPPFSRAVWQQECIENTMQSQQDQNGDKQDTI